MVAKKLSSHMKKSMSPQIDARDGIDCFYCEKGFQHKLMNLIQMSKNDNPKEFDHLNNDETDNRFENLVHGHRLCNQRKKLGFREWEIKAKRKLKDNERSANIPTSHANTDKETATETDTNSIFSEIMLKELAYYLQPQKNGEARKTEIPKKEFLDYVAGKGYKQVGHASQNSMGRILDMFCTSEFPYIKEKNENKQYVIRLRTDEDDDFFLKK